MVLSISGYQRLGTMQENVHLCIFATRMGNTVAARVMDYTCMSASCLSVSVSV